MLAATKNPEGLQFVGRMSDAVDPVFILVNWCLPQRILHVFSSLEKYMFLWVLSSYQWLGSWYWIPSRQPSGVCLTMNIPSLHRVDVCPWAPRLHTVGWMSAYEHPLLIQSGGCRTMNILSSYRRVDVCLWTASLNTVGWMLPMNIPS